MSGWPISSGAEGAAARAIGSTGNLVVKPRDGPPHFNVSGDLDGRLSHDCRQPCGAGLSAGGRVVAQPTIPVR